MLSLAVLFSGLLYHSLYRHTKPDTWPNTNTILKNENQAMKSRNKKRFCEVKQILKTRKSGGPKKWVNVSAHECHAQKQSPGDWMSRYIERKTACLECRKMLQLWSWGVISNDIKTKYSRPIRPNNGQPSIRQLHQKLQNTLNIRSHYLAPIIDYCCLLQVPIAAWPATEGYISRFRWRPLQKKKIEEGWKSSKYGNK